MYLIVAEKPSLARNIIAGIGKLQKDEMKKYNGYFEGGNYIVTWFSAIFSLWLTLRNIRRRKAAGGQWITCPASQRSLNSTS